METIYEDRDEIPKMSLKTKVFHFIQRLKSPTLNVSDCIYIVLIILCTVQLSFSVISDNILEVFYYVSNQSESISAAYTQILYDLKYAFVIVGALLGDCVYGRIPLMAWSYFIYCICMSLSLLCIAFLSPAFYFTFAMIIVLSFTYGIVIINALTLSLNYTYLKRSPHCLHLMSCIAIILGMTYGSSLITRTILFWMPFITGFRLLSCFMILLLGCCCKILFSLRHHFINIPLQGNPIKEYSKAARILSKEYSFPFTDYNATSYAPAILQQASNDYYSRSISHDSIDAIERSSIVLHSSSTDNYYTTQEVFIPSTSSLPSAISEVSDVNSIVNSNWDEPPSSHQGVHLKVLKPAYNPMNTQKLLSDHKQEDKYRETAFLFRNGIQTNLTGQLYRLTHAIRCACYQLFIWCAYEYTECVLLAQYSMIYGVKEPSISIQFCSNLFLPCCKLILAFIIHYCIRHIRYKSIYSCSSLQIIEYGYVSLIITMIITALVNLSIIVMPSSYISIPLIIAPAIFLSTTEVLILYGSFLYYYEESPRRSQAILLSLPFVSRYCGSLLFYALLPILTSLCNIDSVSSSIIHYEISIILQCIAVIFVFINHILFAMKYTYVTEAELDQECSCLKVDNILHPYLMKIDPEKKNRSKSYDSIRSSSSSSSKSYHSVRSISDEIILINNLAHSVSTDRFIFCLNKH